MECSRDEEARDEVFVPRSVSIGRCVNRKVRDDLICGREGWQS